MTYEDKQTRQTGRTTRMVDEAVRRAKTGEQVIIFARNRATANVINSKACAYPNSEFRHRDSVTFGAGKISVFVVYGSSIEADIREITQGLTFNSIFIDHAVFDVFSMQLCAQLEEEKTPTCHECKRPL